MASEKETPSPANEVVNAVKLVGDLVVLPGISLLMQGKVPQGGAHAILGFLAARTLGTVAGPVCWILLAANSYAKATSGSYLHEYVLDLFGGSEPDDAVGAAST
jgi:hypothetical protein